MNLSLLKQGIGISGEDIENIRFSDFSRIQKVITVENLTSFSDTMRKTASLFTWEDTITGYEENCSKRFMMQFLLQNIIILGT